MEHIVIEEKRELPLFKEIIGRVMVDLVKEDPHVLVYDADLANASGLSAVREACPEQFIDCGIQEANMVGTAAASSEAGAIPFAHTFAAFTGRKCIDQLFMAACYPKLNLKLIGSDPGITAAVNGGSHQGMDDMGIMMCLNNITLLEPSDGVMYEQLLRMAKETYGVFYLRVNRKEKLQIYEEGTKFEFGKGKLLREGTDVTLIASGIEVAQSLEAAKILEKEGISARVIDMFCWRPIDEELIAESAEKTGAIVTAENHCTATGLGSAVARVVAQKKPVPMEMIGVVERYGEVGSIPYLMEKFHMDAASIADAARKAVSRK